MLWAECSPVRRGGESTTCAVSSPSRETSARPTAVSFSCARVLLTCHVTASPWRAGRQVIATVFSSPLVHPFAPLTAEGVRTVVEPASHRTLWCYPLVEFFQRDINVTHERVLRSCVRLRNTALIYRPLLSPTRSHGLLDRTVRAGVPPRGAGSTQALDRDGRSGVSTL